MQKDIQVRSTATGAAAGGAGALGALAVGALAVGAVAIGALAIGRLIIRQALVRDLRLEDRVRRRRAGRGAPARRPAHCSRRAKPSTDGRLSGSPFDEPRTPEQTHTAELPQCAAFCSRRPSCQAPRAMPGAARYRHDRPTQKKAAPVRAAFSLKCKMADEAFALRFLSSN